MNDDVQILGETPAKGKKSYNGTRTKTAKLAQQFLKQFYEDKQSEDLIDINDLSDELIAAEAEMIRTRKEYARRKEEALARMAPSQQNRNNKQIFDAWAFESSDVRPRADQTANVLFIQFLRQSQLPPSAFCDHLFQDYIRHLNPYAQIPSCVLDANTVYGAEEVKKPESEAKCILCDEWLSEKDAHKLTSDQLLFFGAKYIMNRHFQYQDLQAMNKRSKKWLCKTHNKTYKAFKLAYDVHVEEKAANNVAKPSSVRAATPPTTTPATTLLASGSSLPQGPDASPQIVVAPEPASELAPEPVPPPVVKPKRQRKKKEVAPVQPAAPVLMASSTPSPNVSSPSTVLVLPQVDSSSSHSTLAELLNANTSPIFKPKARKRPNVNSPALDVTTSPGLPIGSQIPSLTIAQKMAVPLSFQPLQLQAPTPLTNSNAPFLSPPPINYPATQFKVPNHPPAPPVFVKLDQAAITTQPSNGNLMVQEVPNNYLTGEPEFKKPCLPRARQPAANPRSKKAKDPNAPPRRRGGNMRAQQTTSDATISSTPLPGGPPSSTATSSSQARTNQLLSDLPPVLSPVQITAGNLDHPSQKSPTAPHNLSPKNSKQEPPANFIDIVGAMDLYPKGVDVPFITNAAPQSFVNAVPKITNKDEETLTKKQAEEFEDIFKKYSTGDSGSSSSSSPELRGPPSNNNSDADGEIDDADQSLLWNPNGDESLMLGYDSNDLAELFRNN